MAPHFIVRRSFGTEEVMVVPKPGIRASWQKDLADKLMEASNTTEATARPQTDKDAIKFALDHVDPLHIADFLRDWVDEEPLEKWLTSDHASPAETHGDIAQSPRFGASSMSDAEMLALLKYPEIAINFALDYLPLGDIHDFIHGWRSGEDLSAWLPAWRQNAKG